MKKVRLLLSLLLGFICLNMNAQQRIIGGSAINITEAPWQVAIQTNGSWNGGGYHRF